MGKRLLAALILSVACRAFAADRQVALTVYNQDLSLVRDARRLTIPQGAGELRFTDVAAQIDPTSVHFQSLTAPDKVSVLEQNFEYDLVSGDKLLEKYLDQDIQVFTKEGKLFSGRLLSAQGDIVLGAKDGGVQSLARDAVQNVDFPKLPAGLITRPTLVWRLQSPQGGAHDVEISYMTGGMNWHAEYVGVLDKDEKRVSLSAWVSIGNRSGASYEDAKLKLVAGDVHRAAPPPAPVLMRAKVMEMAQDAGGAQFEQKPFFEYHLYTLARPATVKNNETKQVSLFPGASAPVKKTYVYDASQDAKKIKVTLEWVNGKAENLGIPLPAGKIRIYKQDSDKSQVFVGEDRIDHTAKDEKVRMQMGAAFDIAGERRVKETKNLGTRARQETVEVKLRNHKDADVEVTVVEHFWQDWELSKATHAHEKKDANTAEFKVPVKKDQEAVLEYTVTIRW